jgi:L-ascorbate metabolism protein UlaG (beta-lactamase superfamily)
MRVTQIRNATLQVEFGGKKFLIDPMLSEKGGWPGFEGTVNSHVANPTADLPLPMSDILDVDAVIISHTHADHWDDAAKKVVPKDMLHFAQNEKDARELEAAGFRNVRVLAVSTAGARRSRGRSASSSARYRESSSSTRTRRRSTSPETRSGTKPSTRA